MKEEKKEGVPRKADLQLNLQPFCVWSLIWGADSKQGWLETAGLTFFYSCRWRSVSVCVREGKGNIFLSLIRPFDFFSSYLDVESLQSHDSLILVAERFELLLVDRGIRNGFFSHFNAKALHTWQYSINLTPWYMTPHQILNFFCSGMILLFFFIFQW